MQYCCVYLDEFLIISFLFLKSRKIRCIERGQIDMEILYKFCLNVYVFDEIYSN